MRLICGAYWRKWEPGRGRKKNSLSALIEIDMLFSLVPRNLGLYFTVNEPLIYWIESNTTIIAVCGPRNSIRRLVGCVPLPRLKLLQLFIAAHLDFYVCLSDIKKNFCIDSAAFGRFEISEKIHPFLCSFQCLEYPRLWNSFVHMHTCEHSRQSSARWPHLN